MTEFKTAIQAGSSAVYDADILSNGTDVLLAQIAEILLTITDKDENIINSRNAVSILNTAGGVVTDGHLKLTLGPADTARSMADPSRTQARYLHMVFTLVGGAEGVHEVLWYTQGNHIPGDD